MREYGFYAIGGKRLHISAGLRCHKVNLYILAGGLAADRFRRFQAKGDIGGEVAVLYINMESPPLPYPFKLPSIRKAIG